MSQSLLSGLILAHIWSPKFFLGGGFPLPDIIHCWKLSLYAISRKTNSPNLKKCKKTIFGTNFHLFWTKFGPKDFLPWVLQLLDIRNCCKLSLHVISRKTNEPNSRKWQKTQFQVQPKFWSKIFFVSFTPTIDIIHCCNLSLYAILKEKLVNQTRENSKNPSFGLNFGQFSSKFGPQKLFSWVNLLLDFRKS